MILTNLINTGKFKSFLKKTIPMLCIVFVGLALDLITIYIFIKKGPYFATIMGLFVGATWTFTLSRVFVFEKYSLLTINLVLYLIISFGLMNFYAFLIEYIHLNFDISVFYAKLMTIIPSFFINLVLLNILNKNK